MNNYQQFLKYSFFITAAAILVLSCSNGTSTKLKNENKSAMTGTASKHITLINSFEVPSGKLEESIKYWEACRDFLKGQPGYLSTKLHQAFIDATNKMRKELGVPPVEGLKPNASLYTVVRE